MKISVIIPVYNVGDLLRHSVESVLSQSDCSREIIIVDDGSTDGSDVICDEYADRPDVTVVHKSNGGLSSARNAGIDVATGDYLMFLDSDDYLRPGALGLLTRLADATPDADFIQYRYDEAGNYSDHRPSGEPTNPTTVASRRAMFARMLDWGGIGASACTKLISRRVFDSVRFKEGIIHEDEQFTPRLIEQSAKAVYIDNPLYVYVIRPGSIITSRFSRRRLDIIPVLGEQIDLLRRNGCDDLSRRVRTKLFGALCRMYVEARSSDMDDVARDVSSLAREMADAPMTGLPAPLRLIAAGMRMHLPMLPMYYHYNRLRYGKN